MAIVAFDARDAHDPRARGWGRYARCLLAELRARAIRGHGDRRTARARSWRGSRSACRARCAARARRSCTSRTASCRCAALPRRGDGPRPRVRGLPGGLRAADRREVPRVRRRAAARSAERVICVSRFTARRRRARATACDAGEGARDAATRRRCPSARRRPPAGPYLLGVGDLRAKKNLRPLVAAWLALRGEGLPHRLVIAGARRRRGRAPARAGGPAPLELPGYVDDAAPRRAACAAPARSCTRRCTRASAWSCVEAMARGMPVVGGRRHRAARDRGRRRRAVRPARRGGHRRRHRARCSTTRAPTLRRGAAASARAKFSWERGARATAGASTGAAVRRTDPDAVSVDEAPLLRALAAGRDRPGGRRGRGDRQRVHRRHADAVARAPRRAVMRAARSGCPTRRRSTAGSRPTGGDAVLLLNADCVLDAGFLAAAAPRLADERVGLGRAEARCARGAGARPTASTASTRPA